MSNLPGRPYCLLLLPHYLLQTHLYHSTLPYAPPLLLISYSSFPLNVLCCKLLWSIICICCSELCIYLMLWVQDSTNWDSDMCRMWAVQCIKASSPTFRGSPHPPSTPARWWIYIETTQAHANVPPHANMNQLVGSSENTTFVFVSIMITMLNRTSHTSVDDGLKVMRGHGCPWVERSYVNFYQRCY